MNRGGSKLVALTFDDGPGEGTKEILQVLKSENVKATFFVVGKESAKNPELLKQIFSEGHLVGLHSWDHPRFLGFRLPGKAEEEIQKSKQAVLGITGCEPMLFRAPHGHTSPLLSYILKKSGLTEVTWTNTVYDWKEGFNKENLAEKFKKYSDSNKSFVPLLHDRVYKTAEMQEALRSEIQKLKVAGYSFVTLSDVLEQADCK